MLGTDNATNSTRRNTTKCPSESEGEESSYPEDAFTMEQKRNGMIIFHVIAMFYCFFCLAEICDEYFESSLEAICDAMDLKPDVAGATFMAAGGSAPELFTSFMGVFVSKSDIGIGEEITNHCLFYFDFSFPLLESIVLLCHVLVHLILVVCDG